MAERLSMEGGVDPIDATGRRPLNTQHNTEKTMGIKTNDAPAVTKADIPSLSLRVLDGLLNKTGTILYSSHEIERLCSDELVRRLTSKDTVHVHPELQFAHMRAFGEVEFFQIYPESVG